MKIFVFLFTLCLTGAAQAQDSIDIGAAQFARQCTACHVVRDDEGNILVGNSGRAGPNLYGAMGRTVAGVPNFRYGDSIVAARQADVTWTQDNFIAYVQDPTRWLRAVLGDRRARSKMGYRVRSASEAADIFTYLSSLAP